MAATKTFKTAFEIDAHYKGQSAFNKLTSDLHKATTAAKAASHNFTSMFGAVVAGINSSILAWKAYYAVVDLGAASYRAAKEVKKAHDIVSQSNARLVKEGRLAAKNLEKQNKATIELAESMEKAGGIDAETLETGLAGLNRAFSSDQIKKMSKGWQDWMVTIHKGAPTMEQAQEDSKKLERFVLKGNARGLEGLGITKERIAAMTKHTKGMSEQAAIEYRGAQIAKLVGKETGATAEWKKTDAGATYDMNQAQEALLETMGGPLADSERKVTDAMTKLYESLKPVADLIATYLKPQLDAFAKWLTDNKDEIVTFAKVAVDFLNARFKELLVSIQDTWTQGKWLWEKLTAAFDLVKPNWLHNVAWFKDNVTTPLYNLHYWLYEQLGINWENMLKSFDATKEQWTAVVKWFKDWVVTPIYNLFFWLWEKITWFWNAIVPKLNAASAATGGNTNYQQMGGAGGGGGGGTIGSGGTGGEGMPTGESTNTGLAAARAKLLEEAKDPAVRARLYARVKGEVGNQGPLAIQKEMETIFNRAYLRGQTLAETSAQGGKAGNYWGSRYKAVGGKEAAVYDLALAGIRAGSNRANLASGNESAGVRNGQVVATSPGGERYVIEPADVAKHHRLREAYAQGTKVPQAKESDHPLATGPIKMQKGPADANTYPGGVKFQGRGITPAPGASLRDNLRGINMKGRTEGSTPTNVSMSPTINVHGVAAGSEDLMAEKVRRVVQNTNKEFINQMKSSRNYANRTGYV